MRLGLSGDEKKFLHRKYYKEGLTYRESANKVDAVNKKMHQMVLMLNKKKTSPKKIADKFDLEFQKLLNQ